MALLVTQTSVVRGGAANVADLFRQGNYIPVYQRDFVWQGQQIKALWRDLFEHYKHHADSGERLINPSGYFLGAMVVIENGDSGLDEIVDGQQRLTSLTTMAAVCLDVLESLNSSDGRIQAWANQLSNILAQAESGDFVPKLRFSDEDINTFFFQSTFVKKRKTDKEIYWSEPWCKERLGRKKSPFAKMKEAINLGYEELISFLKEAKSAELRQVRLVSFIQLLIEGVIILRIKALSYTNAYAIFESLNNRGIPLSQSDLIKNEVLKNCSQAELEDVAECWQTARQNVESIDAQISMPDFVHYSYISRHGGVKAKDLYDRVRAIAVNSNSAKRYAEHLEEDARALVGLTDTFSSAWKQETCYMLKDINNVLKIRHCYPFLISAYRQYAESPNDFHAHVEAVMNFAFRYMKVIEDPLENFTTAIGKACLLMNNGEPLTKVLTLFREHAPDAQFISKFRDASFTNTKLAYFTVYYLEKIQLGGTFPKDHGIDQNLEHIMPRTPSPAHWPNIVKRKEESSAVFREYLWRIGNLIPLPAEINKSLKNKSIKLKILDPSGSDYTSGKHDLKSPLAVKNFLDDGEWTYKSIEDRQQYLADNLALKAWPL
jgi:hypothetical protein